MPTPSIPDPVATVTGSDRHREADMDHLDAREAANHPSWCARERCTAGQHPAGAHKGLVHAVGDGHPIARMWIEAAPGERPHVAATMAEHPPLLNELALRDLADTAVTLADALVRACGGLDSAAAVYGPLNGP